MDSLDEYLSVLFDGLEGYVYSPVKTATSWEQHWFKADDRDTLKAHITGATGDVYISPAVYSEKRATKDSIKKVQCTWVEFDGNEQIDFQKAPLPSLMVQTSFKSHVHCYWKIEPTNPIAVEDTNRRLTHYLQADSSGWDSTQLLRPPLTTNHKHGMPVELVHAEGNVFNLKDFEFVPEVTAPAANVVELAELIPVQTILKEHQLPLKLEQMVKKEAPVEPYRSSFLARLANELAEENLSHTEIVSLLKEADVRIGKYNGRSDQLIRLSQIADYALHKVIADETLVVYTPDQILNHVDDLKWLLPGWLHSTGLMMLSSAPGVGKTQFLFQLTYFLSVKAGRFMGRDVKEKLRVFWLSLEMDKHGMKYVLSHQKKEWDEAPMFWMIDEAGSYTQYENLIAQYESNVVIIDSLSEIIDDSLGNPQQEAKALMRWIKKIRRRYGVAVIIIHHNRKPTEGNKKPKGLADMAGSFEFGRVSETVLQLWEDQKGIELSSVKARYGIKESFMIERNENLWFTRKQDASNKSEPVRSNPERISSFEFGGDRHGDELHGLNGGEVPPGISNPDFDK